MAPVSALAALLVLPAANALQLSTSAEGRVGKAVGAICRSAVRRASGKQCDAQLSQDNAFPGAGAYESDPEFVACTQRWAELKAPCAHEFDTSAREGKQCRAACWQEGIQELARQFGSISVLLQFGITDMALWDQVMDVASPGPEGITSHQLADTLVHCADGGDRTGLNPRLLYALYDCMADGTHLDGAEMFQPLGCFKTCLNAKVAGIAHAPLDDLDDESVD